MIKAVAHAVAHAKVLELCLREQLVTHAAHFKFQSLPMNYKYINLTPSLIPQDKDHDARISKAEYWSTVEEDDLLLEAFGKCLPSDRVSKFNH